MADPLYTRLKATAERLIAKYGKDTTLVSFVTSGPAHNPTITETENTVKFCQIEYSMTNRNETLVQAGDVMGLISTAGTSPSMDDKIEIDSVRYSFVDIQPLNPGGLTLLFEVHCRK